MLCLPAQHDCTVVTRTPTLGVAALIIKVTAHLLANTYARALPGAADLLCVPY